MIKKLAAIAFMALLLAGCATSTPSPTTSGSPSASPTADGALKVVASTSVWGNIVAQVLGDHGTVQVLVSNTAQDPHSYEATVRDRLAVQKADYVVYNGMGYDDFMLSLNKFATSAVSPFAACKKVAVEHCFYQIGVANAAATLMANDLAKIDPEHQTNYLANAMKLTDDDTALFKYSHGIVAGLDNIEVVETEPLMDPLLSDMGFINVTPSAFTKAIEEGRDIPVAALKEVQDRIVYARMSFLAVNRQTASSQINALVKLCAENGVSVVYFDELLPEGKNYYDWMHEKISEIRKLTGVDDATNG